MSSSSSYARHVHHMDDGNVEIVFDDKTPLFCLNSIKDDELTTDDWHSFLSDEQQQQLISSHGHSAALKYARITQLSEFGWDLIMKEHHIEHCHIISNYHEVKLIHRITTTTSSLQSSFFQNKRWCIHTNHIPFAFSSPMNIISNNNDNNVDNNNVDDDDDDDVVVLEARFDPPLLLLTWNEHLHDIHLESQLDDSLLKNVTFSLDVECSGIFLTHHLREKMVDHTMAFIYKYHDKIILYNDTYHIVITNANNTTIKALLSNISCFHDGKLHSSLLQSFSDSGIPDGVYNSLQECNIQLLDNEHFTKCA